MKKIILTIQEFLLFRTLAERQRIQFTHGNAKKGEIAVSAAATDLEKLGY